MKVLFKGKPLIIRLIPRFDVLKSDTISLSLRNEVTNVVITPEITFESGKRLVITITNEPLDFKIQNKYEIEVKKADKIVYLGKLIVLKEGTDIQNYEYKEQNNGYFKFKE